MKTTMKMVELSELKGYKNNAKIHSEEQILKLKASILEYGYIQPLVVDEKNVLVIGHARYEALKLIDPKQNIQVVDATSLSKTQIKKLRILDNKLTSTDYDDEKLQKEIETLYRNITEDNFDKIAEDLNVDYSAFLQDEGDASNIADTMTKSTRTSITVNFSNKDFPQAKKVNEFLKGEDIYIGRIVLDAMKKEQIKAKKSKK